jgi:hypothetical protein
MPKSANPAPTELHPILTQAQATAVLDAVSSLGPTQRFALLRDLAALLRGRTSIGDGELHRLVASL